MCDSVDWSKSDLDDETLASKLDEKFEIEAVYLFLNGNRIKSVGPEVSRSFPNLCWLDLRGNQIESARKLLTR